MARWLRERAPWLSIGPCGGEASVRGRGPRQKLTHGRLRPTENLAFPYAAFELKRTDGMLSKGQHQLLTLAIPSLRARVRNDVRLREFFARDGLGGHTGDPAAASVMHAAPLARDEQRSDSSPTNPSAQAFQVAQAVQAAQTAQAAQASSEAHTATASGDDLPPAMVFSIIARGYTWEIAVNAAIEGGQDPLLVRRCKLDLQRSHRRLISLCTQAQSKLRSHTMNTALGSIGMAIDLVGIIKQGAEYRAHLQRLLNAVAQHAAVQIALGAAPTDDGSDDGGRSRGDGRDSSWPSGVGHAGSPLGAPDAGPRGVPGSAPPGNQTASLPGVGGTALAKPHHAAFKFARCRSLGKLDTTSRLHKWLPTTTRSCGTHAAG